MNDTSKKKETSQEKNKPIKSKSKKTSSKPKVTTNTSKTKNTKNRLNQFIPKTASEILLTAVFIILLIGVIVLGIKAVNLKKEQNSKNDVDLVIPVLETKTNHTFSVDLSEMKNQDIKEYKFMITNYKDNELAQKDINYKVELTNNNENVSIKLYKNKAENNLLEDSNASIHNIENNKLVKDKKSADTYYLIIRMKDEIKEKENIKIKITVIN